MRRGIPPSLDVVRCGPAGCILPTFRDGLARRGRRAWSSRANTPTVFRFGTPAPRLFSLWEQTKVSTRKLPSPAIEPPRDENSASGEYLSPVRSFTPPSLRWRVGPGRAGVDARPMPPGRAAARRPVFPQGVGPTSVGNRFVGHSAVRLWSGRRRRPARLPRLAVPLSDAHPYNEG